ncbi:ATP-binding cassette sub-family C member 3-like [Schistocerca americana]|uniref:ATP-binding cassette sub-family C member 3-like n=1 Tax=Schistocerca americana TaxID=7009 RepID=UPI001F4FD8E9|nr:ATP-binding cassette sub-family C member 3-like [Schistocerca americana]
MVSEKICSEPNNIKLGISRLLAVPSACCNQQPLMDLLQALSIPLLTPSFEQQATWELQQYRPVHPGALDAAVLVLSASSSPSSSQAGCKFCDEINEGTKRSKTGAMDSKVYKSNPNPKASANPISKLFVWWMRKIVWKRNLTEDDLFDRLDRDATDKLGDRLQKSWDEELIRAKEKGTKPSLARAIFRTFWLRYFIYGVFDLFDQLILR